MLIRETDEVISSKKLVLLFRRLVEESEGTDQDSTTSPSESQQQGHVPLDCARFCFYNGPQSPPVYVPLMLVRLNSGGSKEPGWDWRGGVKHIETTPL